MIKLKGKMSLIHNKTAQMFALIAYININANQIDLWIVKLCFIDSNSCCLLTLFHKNTKVRALVIHGSFYGTVLVVENIHLHECSSLMKMLPTIV